MWYVSKLYFMRMWPFRLSIQAEYKVNRDDLVTVHSSMFEDDLFNYLVKFVVSYTHASQNRERHHKTENIRVAYMNQWGDLNL